MNIKELEIKNFRGIKEEKIIFETTKNVLMIGKNGSGKSNWIDALRMLLDKDYRKEQITELDFNINCDAKKDEIEISCAFSIDDKSSLKNSPIFDSNENEIFLSIKIKWDDSEKEFIKTMYGNRDEKIPLNTYKKIKELDDYISVHYIPHFIQYESQMIFFKNKIFSNNDGQNVSEHVNKEFEKLNINILQNDVIKEYSDSFSRSIVDNFSFDDKNFSTRISSNATAGTPWKSLSFSHYSNEKNVYSNGFGFQKIISILSNYESIKDDSKENIFLIEEPENNMYMPYQSNFMKWVNSNSDFSFTTTHSPHIININQDSSLVKITNDGVKVFNSNKYFKHTHDIFSAAFYDNVLLLEGPSEEMFFRELIYNNFFVVPMEIKELSKKSLFIKSISGIYFEETRKFLISLGINVIIMTDDDYNKNDFQGVKRGYKIAGFNYSKPHDYNKFIEMKSKLENDGILMPFRDESAFETDDLKTISFEESLLYEGFINEEQRNFLSKHKLKNLHELLFENSEINPNAFNNENKIKDSKYIFKWMRYLK